MALGETFLQKYAMIGYWQVIVTMTGEELLTCALDIGERMVVCGGEIWRVEDSVTRICKAGGAERVDIFSITSCIIATIWMPGHTVGITQTRRILSRSTDLNVLDRLNDLSRRICSGEMDPSAVRSALEELDAAPKYPRWAGYLAFALISAAFTYFFGGTWTDTLVSGVIGLVLRFLDVRVHRMELNNLVANLLCSAACGVLAIFAVYAGLGHSVDKIMIGNIMPLVPGVALTNAMRDLFSGDLVSGLWRFIDALLLAASIALGFALAWAALGGIL